MQGIILKMVDGDYFQGDIIGIEPDDKLFVMDLKDGKIQIGEVTSQNQAILLSANKGEIPDNGNLGLNIHEALYDHALMDWKREITRQLELDSQRVNSIKFTENSLEIDANYL